MWVSATFLWRMLLWLVSVRFDLQMRCLYIILLLLKISAVSSDWEVISTTIHNNEGGTSFKVCAKRCKEYAWNGWVNVGVTIMRSFWDSKYGFSLSNWLLKMSFATSSISPFSLGAEFKLALKFLASLIDGVTFILTFSNGWKFPAPDITSKEKAWCFGMRLVDKFLDASEMSPIETPTTKQMKKCISTFLQSWPFGFDLSRALKDLGEKTPSTKARESSELNELWGLDEDLDKGEPTEQTSTLATLPPRGTGDKVLLIDAINRNPKSMFSDSEWALQ